MRTKLLKFCSKSLTYSWQLTKIARVSSLGVAVAALPQDTVLASHRGGVMGKVPQARWSVCKKLMESCPRELVHRENVLTVLRRVVPVT